MDPAQITEEMNTSFHMDDNDKCFDEVSVNKTHEVIYNWVDISEQFITDCSTLDLGQLLHDDMFGLFEGMSAVEMMDPKMDAGMICNQTKHKVLNLPESIQAKTVKVVDFTYTELIGIIDDTLACFVTWLEGHSLAQTVFTNLYMHDPCGSVQDPVLKVFCIGMLKLIDIVRDRVNRASVFEEEDFQTMTYNFKLAYDLSESQVTGMIRDVEEELNRLMKGTRSKPGTQRDTDTQDKHAQAEALHARLKFVRLFLLFMMNIGKDKNQGLDDVKKYLSQMKELTVVIERTVPLGVEPTALEGGDESCVRGNLELLCSLFNNIQQILYRYSLLNCLGSSYRLLTA